MQEVSSKCLSNKYQFELEVKFTGLNDLYQGNGHLSRQKQIQCLEYFTGSLWLIDKKVNNKRSKYLFLHLFDVKELEGEILNLEIVDTAKKSTLPRTRLKDQLYKTTRFDCIEGTQNVDSKGLYVYFPMPTNTEAKLKSVCGTIRISFEDSKGQILKLTLNQGISSLKKSSKNANTSEEVKLICEDVTTNFNKDLLCSMSDVFHSMFENPNNEECQKSAVCLEGIDPSTIKAFKRILLSHAIKEEDLNVSMLLFADRYNIQLIFKLCLNHLKANITKDNFPDIVKASDLLNDKSLFSAVVDFVKKNMGTFKDDPEFKKFIRSNQDCFIKVFEEMIFEK